MKREEHLWVRARALRNSVLESQYVDLGMEQTSMLEALVAVIGADIIDALNKMEN